MKIQEINCENGREIVRNATNQEIEQAEADKLVIDAELQSQLQLRTKRDALLAKLGITEEEAKLLLS